MQRPKLVLFGIVLFHWVTLGPLPPWGSDLSGNPNGTWHMASGRWTGSADNRNECNIVCIWCPSSSSRKGRCCLGGTI